MSNDHLPARFNEAAFRRYESVIAKATSSYPSSTVIDVAGLAPETVAARLRDAIRAYETEHYYSEAVDRKAFLVARQKGLTVRIWRNGTVCIGGSSETKEPREATHSTAKAAPRVQNEVFAVPAELCDNQGVLRACAVLLEHRLLPGRVRLAAEPSNITLFDEHDVVLQTDAYGTFLV